MPTLSVCMIVRDEEHCIARALESVKDLADQIIVVDTGSTDKTKEIALKYTNEVYDFEWCNDFSAARNYSLSFAKSDWTLVLDADEAIEDQQRLKKLLNYENVDAWLLIQETVNENHKNLCPTTRLFRNHLNIRYQNKIHEVVDVCIIKNKYRLGKSTLTLKHLEKPKDLSYKYRWYLEILKDDFENPLRYYYIGVCNIGLGNYGDGAAYIQEALSQELGRGMKATLHLLIADYFLMKEDIPRAIIHCEKAIQICPNQYRGYIALAGLYVTIEEFNKAEQTINKVIQRHKDKLNTDMSNDNFYNITYLEEARNWIIEESKKYQNIETSF